VRVTVTGVEEREGERKVILGPGMLFCLAGWKEWWMSGCGGWMGLFGEMG
jgi:hypothetical protein